MDVWLHEKDVEETCKWLSNLALSHDYTNSIRENSVDGLQLMHVENEMLDKLNVRETGDRLKILNAVFDVREHMKNSLDRRSAATTPPPPLGLETIVEGENEEEEENAGAGGEGEEGAGRVELEEVIHVVVHEAEEEEEEEEESDYDEEFHVVMREDSESKRIDQLARENATLRRDLDERLSRLLKYEVEMGQLQQAYDLLKSSGSKKEKLELAMRSRLEDEVKTLRETNQLLEAELENQQHLHMATSQATVDELNSRLAESDHTAATLRNQASAAEEACEQLELELHQCQNQLGERDGEIQGVTNELYYAREEIQRLEEECRKKSAIAEKVLGLQDAVKSLHDASEKKEGLETRLRMQLEQEVKQLRMEKAAGWRAAAAAAAAANGLENRVSMKGNGAAGGATAFPLPGDGHVRESSGDKAAADRRLLELDVQLASLRDMLKAKNQMIDVLKRETAEKDARLTAVERVLRPNGPLESQSSQQSPQQQQEELPLYQKNGQVPPPPSYQMSGRSGFSSGDYEVLQV